ncbi:hydroxyacid dehydrogenase [Halomonas campisalis]|uniref:Hydroxyacid dehydrogenase n=1 Tax=Billgrantia campisalis TaxID=74661 RepID=A0ABS9P3I4_9GAMM|nr:2-hydroxyacid dehydrogenase [Halomonas campisalis]MCG6656342.1 hydroxyacid dehydrogenase [Halomonas campisalis]MDR5861527.1 2-hydroxyacid dehydrogenase [Halomonas campisalis]
MPKILLTNYYRPEPLSFVKRLVPEGFELLALDQPGQEEVIRQAPQADYLLAGGRTRVDAKVLEAAPRLKMIQRSGVGLDSLDLDAIRQRGIPLYVNEGVNSRSVAEHTAMLMLGTLRKLGEVNAMTHGGQWVKHDVGIRCHDLFDKQVGLIGLGNIGSYVAEMLKGFGVHTVYHKRHRLSADQEQRLGVRYLPLQELLSTSDIISLHCALTADTRNLIGEAELADMKPGAVVINTSRGALIDEAALLGALQSGHVAGAGLDAFAKEPLPSDHPFKGMNNIVMTPHIGGITAETFGELIRKAFSNIALFDARNLEIMTAKEIK